MEYIEGGDLGKVIKKRHGTLFRESEVLHYFVQLVSVIDYIHSNHILHRDLKPDNIFVTKTNMIKLGDFGVARSLDNTFDMANTVIGTPYYLSPEIWEGKPYDSHSDIYSLGVILYELCALKKPYEAPNALALCSIVTKGGTRGHP
ncbi:CAMK family protein kinase [Histomonas meleagridis]|uniref:CAMK family protein kinase n=1 Tax=Histomonas meleagridis TaxID=135588 RepID=UPI003559D3B1|nr:CAMK family protein kinase [Histomonas meleagridis]